MPHGVPGSRRTATTNTTVAAALPTLAQTLASAAARHAIPTGRTSASPGKQFTPRSKHMDMITSAPVDEQRLQELAGKAASDAASGLAVLLAYMGDQTGCHRRPGR